MKKSTTPTAILLSSLLAFTVLAEQRPPQAEPAAAVIAVEAEAAPAVELKTHRGELEFKFEFISGSKVIATGTLEGDYLNGEDFKGSMVLLLDDTNWWVVTVRLDGKEEPSMYVTAKDPTVRPKPAPGKEAGPAILMEPVEVLSTIRKYHGAGTYPIGGYADYQLKVTVRDDRK